MAYIEVRKNGEVVTRREVDDAKARSGFALHLGDVGKAHVAIGKPAMLGEYAVRVVEGGGWDRLGGGEAAIEPIARGLPSVEGYEITGKLGEGGMGVVWRAVQLGTKREVALKFLSGARFASDRSRARFEREVELSARLEHPNIARVYDSGLHHGVYYYAMELLNGVHLDHYVAEGQLGPRQVLELMRAVCRAVQHAHQRGVIHRDLKPSNILVTPDGVPHVVDFGLARTFLEEDSGLMVSVEGEVSGTPAYMSPEQAAGRLKEIDTRTDVYSLGVILYRLLTGQSPHELSGTKYDVIRRIVEQEVRRPRDAGAAVDRELEAVLLKALAHDPADRYASAGDLADDIDNYLSGEPLTARRPTTLYFLRKRIGRHIVPVSVAAGVLGALIGLAAFSYVRITRERNRVEVQRGETAKALARALGAEALASKRLLDANAARKDAELARDEAERLLGTEKALRLELQEKQQKLVAAMADANTARVKAVDALESEKKARAEVQTKHEELLAAMTEAERQRVSAVTQKGMAEEARRKADDAQRQATAAQREATKRLIAKYVSLGWEEGYYLYHVEALKLLHESRDGNAPPVGQEICHRIRIRQVAESVWRTTGGLRRYTAPGPRRRFEHRYPPWVLAFSPDGKRLLSGSGGITIRNLDRTGHVELPLRDQSAIRTATFSPDGTRIVTASADRTARVWNASTGEPVTGPLKHKEDVRAASFSPDGKLVVSCCGRTAQAWDAKTGEPVALPIEHQDIVRVAAFSPDGRHILTAADEDVRTWDTATAASVWAFTHETNVYRAGFSPDGNQVLLCGSDGHGADLAVLDANNGKLVLAFHDPSGDIEGCTSFSPDGKWILTAGPGRTASIWDAGTGKQAFAPLQHGEKIYSAAFSADGRLLITASGDKTARVWDVETGQPVTPPLWHTNEVIRAAFSPDGACIATATLRDSCVHIWDIAPDVRPVALLAWEAQSQAKARVEGPGIIRALTKEEQAEAEANRKREDENYRKRLEADAAKAREERRRLEEERLRGMRSPLVR